MAVNVVIKNKGIDSGSKIFVTQPSLPPLIEFEKYLKDIWRNKKLTNNGKYHQEFETKLCDYLGVQYCSLVANGTLGLVLALQALKITGEVITTPYSFVATTHALWWNNIKPVFVDIEPDWCNLDPEKIESAITPKTTAIVPVHVYGNPCQVERIQEIADKYNLKVIYDAAHAFGMRYKGQSICNFGDLSVLSFHATKVFNTFEGGAIVCHDEKTKRHIDDLKNFGFRSDTKIVVNGINAKMNEMQAALGLLQLKYIKNNIAKRKEITRLYRQELATIPGISFLEDMNEVEHNYAYFPIFIDEQKYGKSRDELFEKLHENGIYSRRYFYPLISNFETYNSLKSAAKKNLPVANKIAEQVLCLPIFSNLDLIDFYRIVDTIIYRNFMTTSNNRVIKYKTDSIYAR